MFDGQMFIGHINLLQTYGLKIQHRPIVTSAARKLEINEDVPKPGGAILYDSGQYYNGRLEFDCIMKSPTAAVRRQRQRDLIALLNTGTYQEMRYYDDPDYTYRVVLSEPLEFTSNRGIEEDMYVKIVFSCVPFKRRTEKQILTYDITTSSTFTINNPEKFIAHPLYTLAGFGNFTFGINGRSLYDIKATQYNLIMDAETGVIRLSYSTGVNITDIVIPRSNNTESGPPTLRPGNNSLIARATGNNTGTPKLTVDTRLGAIM